MYIYHRKVFKTILLDLKEIVILFVVVPLP
jgi:hypothetical protein